MIKFHPSGGLAAGGEGGKYDRILDRIGNRYNTRSHWHVVCNRSLCGGKARIGLDEGGVRDDGLGTSL